MVFICLFRLHRPGQLVCTHNKLGMMHSMWETAGVWRQTGLETQKCSLAFHKMTYFVIRSRAAW